MAQPVRIPELDDRKKSGWKTPVSAVLVPRRGRTGQLRPWEAPWTQTGLNFAFVKPLVLGEADSAFKMEIPDLLKI
jgi:hypothetical protein